MRVLSRCLLLQALLRGLCLEGPQDGRWYVPQAARTMARVLTVPAVVAALLETILQGANDPIERTVFREVGPLVANGESGRGTQSSSFTGIVWMNPRASLPRGTSARWRNSRCT